MIETLVPIILIIVENTLKYATEQAINFVVRKVVDAAGNVVTQFVHLFDSNGDGDLDSEEILCSFSGLDVEICDGFFLCNNGDQIGIGLPEIEIVDGTHLPDILDDTPFTGTADKILTDYDGDGFWDDVLYPVPDVTGDGVGDWFWLVDRDDNGLPDVSEHSPFYPVGSEEYEIIIERAGLSDEGIMEKRVDRYNVTEGFLALILLFTFINFVRGLFRRSDYLR